MGWCSLKKYKQETYQGKYTDFTIFDEWAKKNNITQWWSGYRSNKKLDAFYYECSSRIKDHVAIFRNKDTKQIMITSQPYTDINDPMLYLELVEWCNKHDFKFTVYESQFSWYYPNDTILIVLTQKAV